MHTDVKGNIFLIDDHPTVRQGLSFVLAQASYQVCGEAGCIAEMQDNPYLQYADMALLDLSLGDEDGLQLLKILRKRGIATLVYSMHEDAVTIERALRAGASGYVSKREMADILLAAITQIMRGNRYLGPRTTLALEGRDSTPEVKLQLSEREHQIMALLGAGETNSEIAATLHISMRTVETYFFRIHNKLGLPGTRELRSYAIKNLKPGK